MQQWFGTRGSEVQILSPRPFFSWTCSFFGVPVYLTVDSEIRVPCFAAFVQGHLAHLRSKENLHPFANVRKLLPDRNDQEIGSGMLLENRQQFRLMSHLWDALLWFFQGSPFDRPNSLVCSV